jgi:hypothetical protein
MAVWAALAAVHGQAAEEAVFSMKPNEIRGPVESDFGYHIIRLDGIQAAQTVTAECVRWWWMRCASSRRRRCFDRPTASAIWCRKTLPVCSPQRRRLLTVQQSV